MKEADHAQIVALAEKVLTFAREEAAKITPLDVEALAITALIHAASAASADAAGKGADESRVLAVAETAAQQVFDAVQIWHATRTERRRRGPWGDYQ